MATPITTSTDSAAESTAANIIIFVPQVDAPAGSGAAKAVDEALDGAISALAADGEIKGKHGDVTVVHTLGKMAAKRVLVAGLGKPEKLNVDALRDAAAGAARRARGVGGGTLAIAIDGDPLGASEAAQAVVEGVQLGLYRFDRHRSPSDDRNEIDGVTLHGSDEAAMQRGAEVGEILAEATNFCRDLANEPSNILTPTELAARATQWAEDCGVEIEIIEEGEAAELGMGSFLGVAKGSHEPAKFIVMRYRGGGDEPPIGLIGKGITFDTGGISIKPANNMEAMKQDMSGAAAVIAATGAIAKLGLPINVTALAPATENMPGGSAIKPGDVLKAMNGKTIEVINTDAEGRLILADALSYANHLGLTPLLDVATLTGACAVALGNVATGIMTNDDDLAGEVIEAGARAGEKIWQLPMYEEYEEQIKSNVADVKNTGGRLAGAQTAAKLLAMFSEDTPWAHLDMAGTDDSDKVKGIYVKGATGTPVRTLVNFVRGRAEARG
jgi:leucyl aminopeptidase